MGRPRPQGARPGPVEPAEEWPWVGAMGIALGTAIDGWPAILVRVLSVLALVVYTVRYVAWRRQVGGGWLWH